VRIVGVGLLPFRGVALGVHEADGRVVRARFGLVVVLFDWPLLPGVLRDIGFRAM